MTSSPNSFLSAPTTAGSILTPASTTSSRDPSIRTANASFSNPTAAAKSPARRTTTSTGFAFHKYYDWPAFFTLQPNATTRLRQLQIWSQMIQGWCRHHRTFRLSLIDAVDLPLFNNSQLRRRIDVPDARTIIDWMAKSEGEGGGGRRAEWVPPGGGGGVTGGGSIGAKSVAWIWWRTPEEWATLIADWVDETGQKNTVLTLYELAHGEATVSQEFHGMDSDVLLKSLNILIKRSKAQVFGSEDQQGVKFF